jgi:Tfp pilus assembly protein PilO
MAIKKLANASNVQVITGSIIVVVVMAIVLIVVGKTFVGKIVHNSKVIGAKQDAERQLKDNLAALPKLQTAYNQLGNIKDSLSQALPTKSSFPALVATMEVVAGSSNVDLQSVSPGGSAASSSAAPSAPAGSVSTTAATGPEPFGFSTQISGSYASILKYLSNLQLMARPVTITNVQLSGQTSSMTASVTANTYYYNPPILQDKTKEVK